MFKKKEKEKTSFLFLMNFKEAYLCLVLLKGTRENIIQLIYQSLFMFQYEVPLWRLI